MRTTLKLTQIIDDWIAETDILPATKADYRRKINLWFRWLSSVGVDPRHAERRNIVEYKRHLQTEGRSVLTVCSYVTVVKLFYRYCSCQRYCENIGTGIRSSVKHREYYKAALSRSEASALMDSIDTSTTIGRRDKLIVALMLINGLRACEVERINISDFDMLKGRMVLHIQRKGKVDKRSTIALPELIGGLFEDYIGDRDFEMDDPLIISHAHGGGGGRRLSKITISAIVKQRLRDIGIDRPDITAHSLRHTCGSLMVESGVDVETIKDILGHTDTQTTRIYVEMAQQRRLLENSPSNIIAGLISKKPKKKKGR
ncbi:site-specific tyrosine recombinase XerD [Alistipes indistinctus]|uniref:tyrosine-type recombinase/integrase n=1 Tax=Alistipes indistinctus TaxID=626932 RepID=UPI0036F2283F